MYCKRSLNYFIRMSTSKKFLVNIYWVDIIFIFAFYNSPILSFFFSKQVILTKDLSSICRYVSISYSNIYRAEIALNYLSNNHWFHHYYCKQGRITFNILQKKNWSTVHCCGIKCIWCFVMFGSKGCEVLFDVICIVERWEC